MAVNLHTTHYRFGINSGTESTHGWHDNEDSSPGDVITPGMTFLLRFTVQETGGTAAANVDNQFQYSKNGGAFTNITTGSSNVKAVTTSVFADGANLTKRLSGTGTFESTAAGGTHDGLSGGNNNDIAANGNSETECALQIVAGDVAPGDVIAFRLSSPDFTITNDVVPSLAIRSHGVSATSATGTMVKVLSVALVGLSLAVGQGIMSGSGSDGATLLTGQAMTSATGTVVQSASVGLSGIELTGAQGQIVASGRSLIQSSQGTATPNLAVPLVGQVSTVGQGFVFANNNGTVGPLIGSSLSALQGNVLTPGSIALTGSAITSAAGTLSPILRPTDPVGQAMTSAAGVVSILSNNVTVHITGEEMTASTGTVDPRPILTGLASTSAQGTVTQSADVALVGQAITIGQFPGLAVGQDPDDIRIISAQGAPTVSSTRALTGSAITGAQGTVGTSADASFALTGSAATSAAGTPGAAVAVSLIGASITGQQGTLGAPGGATLTGQAIVSGQGTVFTMNDRTQALTGSASAFAQGTVVSNASVSLTGEALSVSAGSFLAVAGGNIQQALSGQSMTARAGTLTASGGDVIQGSGVNEGCDITTGSAIEGCGITAATAGEILVIKFGWGDLPWGDPWGGYEQSDTISGVAKESI